MKYLILLYGSQQDYDVLSGKPPAAGYTGPVMTPEQVGAMHRYMGDFHQKLMDSGEFVDARGLAAPVHARRIRLENGAPVVTDGPYPETQEVLAGFTVVECAGYDRATEIAAGLVNPDHPGDYVDIRPVAEGLDDLV